MNRLLRTVTFLSLLTISLASYFFLEVQHYRTNQGQQLTPSATIEQTEQESAPLLPAPDVILVKKVLETARHFVPSSTVSY